PPPYGPRCGRAARPRAGERRSVRSWRSCPSCRTRRPPRPRGPACPPWGRGRTVSAWRLSPADPGCSASSAAAGSREQPIDGTLRGLVYGAVGDRHGLELERRALLGGPLVTGLGRGRLLQLHHDRDGLPLLGELGAELAVAEETAYLLPGLGPADRLH